MSHEKARSPEEAKHAFCASDAAGPLLLLQDFTGPFAPGERLEVYPHAGSQLRDDMSEACDKRKVSLPVPRRSGRACGLSVD